MEVISSILIPPTPSRAIFNKEIAFLLLNFKASKKEFFILYVHRKCQRISFEAKSSITSAGKENEERLPLSNSSFII